MIAKKIAILGGGNGAHTMAAEMTLKGHTVNLYEMPQFKDNMKEVFETKTIFLKGNIPELQGKVKLNMVTDDIAKAVEGCHYICIVTPAFAHLGYAKLLKGHVHKDQIIVTFPGAFGALVLRNVLGD
ncbi:MAG: NAD/NADP octopine/nopaline dehydrogenase, partial [Clostridia bacterium]|nr:NAD/NADP octopine/nopaline dehydrogenase [Clostridia bacterium]